MINSNWSRGRLRIGCCARVQLLNSRCLLAVAIALTIEATAKAGDSDATDQTSVTVRGEPPRDRAAQSSSRAIVVTSEEQIRSTAPQTVPDALRRRPSTSVQQTTPGQGTVYVRGLSGRELAHRVDGVKLNAAIFREGNNPYLGLVDPYAVEDIEVVPGAASVLYGSEALGGALLVHTALPGYRLDDALTGLSAVQVLSSNPASGISRLAIVHASPDTAVQAGATAVRAGPVRPGEDFQSPVPESYLWLERAPGEAYRPTLSSEQPGTEYSFFSADVAARRKLGPGLEVVTRTQLGVRPELLRYDQVTPRFKLLAPARADSGLRPMLRAMASTEFVRRATSGPFDMLLARLAWQRLSERSELRNLGESCVPDPDAEPEQCPGPFRLEPSDTLTIERNRSDALSVAFELESRKRDGTLVLIAGADLVHDIVSSEAERKDLPTGALSPAPSRFPDGSTSSEAGAFAEIDGRIAGGLRGSLGVRGSAFLLDVTERSAENGGPSPGFARTFFDFAAGIGTRYAITEHFGWFANAGRGVRAPNVQDFATLGPRAQGRFQLPNPDIESEHSYSVDTGFKLAARRHRAQIALFYLYYDNAIVIAPTTLNGAALTAEGDQYTTSFNAASIEISGIEAAADLVVVSPASIFGRFLAMIGTHRNPPGAGLPLETPADRIPPAQGELGVRLEPTRSTRFELFASGRAAQRRLNDPVNLEDNRIPEGGTPGYVTYHAHAAFRAERRLLLRLLLDNLSNELVLEHGSGFYRAGFSATAGAELDFD